MPRLAAAPIEATPLPAGEPATGAAAPRGGPPDGGPATGPARPAAQQARGGWKTLLRLFGIGGR